MPSILNGTSIISGAFFFRYWKMSLLVHPDKCSHPQANQAFIRLNNAFKELQDPDKVVLSSSIDVYLILTMSNLLVARSLISVETNI